MRINSSESRFASPNSQQNGMAGLHASAGQGSFNSQPAAILSSLQSRPATAAVEDALTHMNFDTLDLDHSGGVSESEFVKLVRRPFLCLHAAVET